MLRLLVVVSFCFVLIVATARVLAPQPCCPPNPSLMQKLAHRLAFWWITHRVLRDDAPTPPSVPYSDPYQQMAHDLQRHGVLFGQESIARQQMRTISSDGTPQLDHSAGW